MILCPENLELMCSAKAARSLKVKPSTAAASQPGCFLCQWRIEAARGHPGDYWLVTNLPTLFSFLLPRTRADRLPAVLAAFNTRLNFALLGGDPPFQWRPKEIVLVRGNPRAVIGSMNDMVGLLERTAGRPDWAPAKDDEDFINITPFSAINWDYPRRRFQTELQKLLDHRPGAC
jgi:hypothetical protein